MTEANIFKAFHFLAGLSTGCLSATLLQPADLLKTRLQQSHSATLLPTLRAILAGPNALGSLWRGTLPSVIRTGIGSALYFSTLNAFRQHALRSSILGSTGLRQGSDRDEGKISSSSLPRLSNVANLTSGAIARASVGFVMMPITIIKVRYESNIYSYNSIWSAGTAIIRSEGLKGFFSGFGATAARDAPYAGFYVLFYEQSKRRLSHLRGARFVEDNLSLPIEMSTTRSAAINFTSSVLAAGLATAMTNPFDAIKTRLQLMPQKYSNIFTAGVRMVRDDGLRSLFDGLGLRMGRKAMSSALAWTLYEDLIKRAEVRMGENAIV